ncbi:MAG: hypothetical protein WEG56_09830 [Chloroflexota bacterium]
MLADRLRTPTALDEPAPSDRSMIVMQYAVAVVAALAAALLAIH